MGVSERAAARLAVLVLLGVSWLELGWSQERDIGPASLPLTLPETCRESGAVFLTGNLSCVACPPLSEPAVDGLSCSCRGNATRVAGDASSTPSCSPCEPDQVVSSDGLYCVECVAPLTFEPSTRSCSSCSSELLIYLDTPPSLAGFPGNRTCVECPQGAWSDLIGSSCVECGLDNCSQCVDPHNGRCFPSSLPSPNTPNTHFSYYTKHFTATVGLCRYGNQEACQLLVNLCVLQNYLKSDPACVEVSSISSPLLPPLYFPPGASQTKPTFTDTLYTSPSHKGVSQLPLVVAQFALNGSFLGLHNISDQLLICRDLPPRYRDAWRVGVQYEIDCLVGVASLSPASSDPTFYDLYWLDRSERLHPLPVLPRGYVESDSGDSVNLGTRRGAWQLVTRFFLSEGVSSAPRYARDITLRIELDSGGRVSIPYLSIDYEAWEPDPDSTDTIRAGFSVVYSQDIASFNITLSVCVVVMAILVGVVCGLRLNGFLRRTNDLCCTFPAYVFLVAEFCGLMSSALFLILSFSCTVILILYKGQILFVYTLPTGSQLLVFQLLLPIALLFRVVQVVYMVWGQTNIDIFLLDWERPREQPTNQIAEQPTQKGGVVSIWRTYFIANEFNEIQTCRRGLRPISALLIALLFLQVIGLRNLAEHDPVGHVTTSPWRHSAPHSPLLRFALTSLVFTTIAITMRIYMFLFHERFIEDKIHQFIDLCSVSNVSVFIMWHRCYGYYIEGRSVHGRADTDMREMNRNLLREQEDVVGRRGLMPNSDLQTFQIALTRQFRMHYDRILTPLRTEVSEGRDQLSRGGGDNMPHPTNQVGGVSETQLAAYEQMTSFLSAFISHNLQGLDYTTRSKVILERLLDFELRGPEERSLFYEDTMATFSRLLFLGQEWSLWQLDLLVFAFVDMLANDYVLAAVIAALVAWGVLVVREVLGRRILAQKTLVDKRFLV